MSGKPQPPKPTHMVAPALLDGIKLVADEVALLHAAVNRLATAVEILVRRGDPARGAKVRQ